MNRSGIEVHNTSLGAKIYRIPLDLFPGLQGYAHIVIKGNIVALIDVGSGFGDCNGQLEAGLEEIQYTYNEKANWDAITHVLISHGHIDHFGGLHFVQERCEAPVGIHELDQRVLIYYEDRLTIVARRLHDFLIEAGVSSERQKNLMDLYLLNKHLFRSVPLDFTFNEVGMQIGPISIIHVPGHCPGQVVFKIDDILLSSDHVLQNTSPHQAPEQLTLNTGLGHYLDSLEKIRSLSKSVNLVLGGHEGPFYDLEARILEIMRLHEERLNLVMEALEQPRTIAEVSDVLFPDVEGYHELLAIEETGAHVEYLTQRGYVSIDNLEQMEVNRSLPVRYRKRENIPKLSIVSECVVLE